jgi:hypothetical protein
MKILPVCGLLLLATASFAQQTQNSPPANMPQPTAPKPKFEATLSKTVVRIMAQAEGLNAIVNGTGFLVEVPEARLPGNSVVVYLVTNRHVAKVMEPDATGHYVSHRVIRMQAVVNLKSPVNGTKAYAVPLPPDGPFQWHFPADASIDLAAIPFHIEDNFDVERISTMNFLTPDVWEKLRIGPGDKVVTTGLFSHYAGAHEFQPIIREGSLAMVPDDVMPGPLGLARIYLADLHIIPGNSGSPLFLAPAWTLGGQVTDSNGGIPYGLLGVVNGYMWEDDQLTLHAATDYEATIHANSGIAMIVPVEQLKALLYSTELQRERDLALADYKRQHAIP